MTILFLKLWQDKETAANGEEGGKRGFKNRRHKRPEENDDRPENKAQENEEKAEKRPEQNDERF